MGGSHVRHLAEAGASVIIGDLREDLGKALEAELVDAGHEAHFARLDVTDEGSWTDLVNTLTERFGGLDGLVNNAGIAGTTGGPEVEDLEAWNKTVAVNQTGTYLGIRMVLPLMRAAKSGSIVNISSVNGIVGDGDFFGYSATKAAVRLMTRSAAHKYASDGIRVNSVCPGLIRTPMNEDEVDMDSWIDRTPLKRMGDAGEVSKAVRFLLSDEASFITGSDIIVDGGYIA